MTYLEILHAQLRIDEGVRSSPYTDSVGKLTIGVGRNLTDVGVSGDEIELMLDNDITSAEKSARKLLPNFDALSDARKAVVVNMAFNLGEYTFSTFQNTLRNIRDGRWEDAATSMLQSKWSTQVGARAQRLADSMRQG